MWRLKDGRDFEPPWKDAFTSAKSSTSEERSGACWPRICWRCLCGSWRCRKLGNADACRDRAWYGASVTP
ncbi:hypothetical protein T484DRAFT_1924242 [Baffinella frigidus]|nr:hypothetical protein T484DRAFT_1924242 [Cryptophyta sp. CCMP2293]